MNLHMWFTGSQSLNLFLSRSKCQHSCWLPKLQRECFGFQTFSGHTIWNLIKLQVVKRYSQGSSSAKTAAFSYGCCCYCCHVQTGFFFPTSTSSVYSLLHLAGVGGMLGTWEYDDISKWLTWTVTNIILRAWNVEMIVVSGDKGWVYDGWE